MKHGTPARLHPGDPDDSFADRGALLDPPPSDVMVGLSGRGVQLPDGKILLAAMAVPGPQLQLRRYTAEGTVDRDFGDDGIVAFPDIDFLRITDAVLQGDGNLLVYGMSTKASEAALLRFTPEGALDSAFGSGGIASAPIPVASVTRRMVLLPDGRVIATGVHASASWFVRFTSDGHADKTFGEDGLVSLARVIINGPMIVRNGRFLAVGTIDRYGVVAKYDLDGSLDVTFGVGGYFRFAPYDPEQRVALWELASQPDGKLIAAGEVGIANGLNDAVVLRLHEDGSPDATFNEGTPVLLGPYVESTRARAILVETDGSILVATDGNSRSTAVLVRLTSDGTVDRRFGMPNIDGTVGYRGYTYCAIQWPALHTQVYQLFPAVGGGVLVLGESQVEVIPIYRAYMAKHVLTSADSAWSCLMRRIRRLGRTATR